MSRVPRSLAEGLLVQKVLEGKTKGYKNHPQLDRFKKQAYPKTAIGLYLLEVWKEADRRGYAFNRRKVKNVGGKSKSIPVTRGQLRYEWEHLWKKLRRRDPARYKTQLKTKLPKPHPLFRVVRGGVEKWEKT